MNVKRCENCKYMQCVKHYDDDGCLIGYANMKCHRMPPVPQEGFPEVLPNEWCGEFTEKTTEEYERLEYNRRHSSGGLMSNRIETIADPCHQEVSEAIRRTLDAANKFGDCITALKAAFHEMQTAQTNYAREALELNELLRLQTAKYYTEDSDCTPLERKGESE